MVVIYAVQKKLPWLVSLQILVFLLSVQVQNTTALSSLSLTTDIEPSGGNLDKFIITFDSCMGCPSNFPSNETTAVIYCRENFFSQRQEEFKNTHYSVISFPLSPQPT